MELKEHKKPVLEHQEIIADVQDQDLSQHVIRNVFAVDKLFEKVSFKQSDISNAYLRNCRFVDCDFTGTVIASSNFRGATFEGCDFRYSTWAHTILDDNFLDKCLPSEENLARDLARSLRVNFAQIGNYEAVNKAASIEVALTGQHLFQAAYSKQSHYRKKHKGWDRVLHGLRHARWKLFDLLWGNGESILRIFVTALFFHLLSSVILAYEEQQLSFSDAFTLIAVGFWGVTTSPSLPAIYAVSLTIGRFLLFGLFMAVLIKRLSRR